jgi:hypothetical protein
MEPEGRPHFAVHGALTVYGDSAVSQLRSTLYVSGAAGEAHDCHPAFLTRLVADHEKLSELEVLVRASATAVPIPCTAERDRRVGIGNPVSGTAPGRLSAAYGSSARLSARSSWRDLTGRPERSIRADATMRSRQRTRSAAPATARLLSWR